VLISNAIQIEQNIASKAAFTLNKHFTNVRQTSKISNKHVECFVGIDVFPNNIVCQCPKQNFLLIIRTLWHTFCEKPK
jgi:hypothetical protein